MISPALRDALRLPRLPEVRRALRRKHPCESFSNQRRHGDILRLLFDRAHKRGSLHRPLEVFDEFDAALCVCYVRPKAKRLSEPSALWRAFKEAKKP